MVLLQIFCCHADTKVIESNKRKLRADVRKLRIDLVMERKTENREQNRHLAVQ